MHEFQSSSIRRSSLLLALGLLGVVAAACGGGSGAAGVATLENGASAAEDQGDMAPEDAALAFSQCMRDEGLDFPDLFVDAEGNIELRAALQTLELDLRDENTRETLELCRSVFDDVGFGGGGRAGLTEDPALQDALLDYSDCLRSEGLDVGDVTLGQGGPPDGPAGGGGGEPGAGQGERQQGFGDPGDRIAASLDVDAEDPAVAAALDACAPILDQAFAGFTLGAPATGDGEN